MGHLFSLEPDQRVLWGPRCLVTYGNVCVVLESFTILTERRLWLQISSVDGVREWSSEVWNWRDAGGMLFL